jgi:hypothetical protein
MITLYHRTAEEIARQIIAHGFRDGEGSYMTTQLHSGVWVSDQPLDANEGACGNALIRIELAKDEAEIGSFEWIEDGKPYREWFIPATLLNEFGKITIQEIDDEPILDDLDDDSPGPTTVRVNITTFEHPDCTRIEIVLIGDEDSRSLTKAAVLMAIDRLKT